MSSITADGLAAPAAGPVLFPFVTIALQQHTGSFALSFLCIPVLMVAMAIGVTMMVPEHSGKELNEIIV
jgi:MFS transporter, SHS family, lactate transporter